MKEHQESLLSQTEKIQSVVQTLDDTTSFKNAIQQQNESIQATTKMHDVLARVASEVSVQSKQLQQRGDQQANALKTSSDAIIKNQRAFEQRIANFTTELPLALPVTQPSAPQTNETKAAPKPVRRRDPKKPVMFLRPEAVTAMRSKNQHAKLHEVEFQPKDVQESKQPKQTISIGDLKQRLGIKPTPQPVAEEAAPSLLMPTSDRLRGRVRAAAADDADRLSLVDKKEGQPPVQRKKAA
jgi:hypothetical protein